MDSLQAILPFLAFAASGFSGLTLEILWVRLAALGVGITTWAITVVVSTFMLGLALGSWVAGPLCDRVRNPARLYAGLELGIAILAVLASLYLRALPVWSAGLELSRPLMTVLAGLGILAPCFLMGATLPALSRVASAHPARFVSRLYAINTAGAVLACLATDWLLVPRLGVHLTLAVAVSLNLTAAALASQIRMDEAPRAEQLAAPLTRIHLAYALSGLAALGLQLAWTRLMMGMSRPTIYNFSTVLAVYLGGLALGSAAASGLANRVRNASTWLAGLQCLIAAFTLLGLVCIGPADAGLTAAIHDGLPNLPAMPRLALTCGARALVLFGLPALCMGAAFPFAVRAVLREEALGSSVGRLYAANTLGTILGGPLATFVLLPALGLCKAFLVLTALVALAAGLVETRFLAAAAVFVVLAVGAPSDFLLKSVYLPVWQSTWGVAPTTLSYFRDDSYGTVGVADSRLGPLLLIDSTMMMGTRMDGMRYARLMGHLPCLLHPHPKKALVICFGCGMSAGALSAQDELEEARCVELSPAVLGAGDSFRQANQDVLHTGRVQIRLDDGRNHLLRTRERYDVITFEPPPPTQAGVVNLYSSDYYRLCRERLTDDGILCQWVPIALLDQPDLELVVRAFVEVFPDAWLFEGSAHDWILIGSKQPLHLSLEELDKRMQGQRLKPSLEGIGISTASHLLATLLHGPAFLKEQTRSVPLTSDNHPYLEYSQSTRPRWSPVWTDRHPEDIAPVLREKVDLTGIGRGLAALFAYVNLEGQPETELHVLEQFVLGVEALRGQGLDPYTRHVLRLDVDRPASRALKAWWEHRPAKDPPALLELARQRLDGHPSPDEEKLSPPERALLQRL